MLSYIDWDILFRVLVENRPFLREPQKIAEHRLSLYAPRILKHTERDSSRGFTIAFIYAKVNRKNINSRRIYATGIVPPAVIYSVAVSISLQEPPTPKIHKEITSR